MKLVLAFVPLMISAGILGARPSSDVPAQSGSKPVIEDVFDDLWLTDSIDWQGTVLRVGDTQQFVVDSLGGRVSKDHTLRPGQTTGRKIRSHLSFASRLLPDMTPLYSRLERLADQCGESCFVGGVARKIGKRDNARFVLMGSGKEDLRVAMIIIDQGHNSIATELKRGFADDLTGTSYVATDDGTYRISRGVSGVRIEKMK